MPTIVATPPAATAQSPGRPPELADPDWHAIEASDEFRELVRRRRRFVAPATAFFLSWYLGFILLAGYAADFMGRSIYQGFTVGYGIALTQFLMVWSLAVAYMRYSERTLDPLRDALVARAEVAREVLR